MAANRTKSAVGVVRLADVADRPAYTVVGVAEGRGVARWASRERQNQRVAASGRIVEEPLNIFDSQLVVDVGDTPKAASILQWLYRAGRLMLVQYDPAGTGNGLPRIEFTAIVLPAARLQARREFQVTLLATTRPRRTTQS